MSLLIDDIGQDLHNQAIGVLGTTLFKTYLPESPDAALAVLDTGGIAPSVDLPIKEPTFQIFIRSTSYALGRAKLDLIRARYHQQRAVQLVPNGIYFYYIYAIAEGGHLGKDESGRDLFSINFRCKTR